MIIKNTVENKLIGLLAVRAHLTSEVKLLRAQLEFQRTKDLLRQYEETSVKLHPGSTMNQDLDFERPDADPKEKD